MKNLIVFASFSFAIALTTASPCLALGPLPQELNDPNSWTPGMLESIYDQADEKVSSNDFENYVEVNSYNPLTPHETEPGIYYYNRCIDFGADSIQDVQKSWQLATSFAFKVSKKRMNAFGRDFENSHYQNAGDLPEVFFVGGWIPEKIDLVYSISQIFSSSRDDGKLSILVQKNRAGIYSDFPAPVSYSYRTFKDVLVGKMTVGSGVVANYQVCYRPASYFCHIYGKSGSVVINLISRGTTQEQAEKPVLNEINDDLYYCSDTTPADAKNRCLAARAAKRSMKCSDHYEDLDLDLK